MIRKGIVIAGNVLTDNVKIVQSYPEKGMLATIMEESIAVGGCVPNTAIDIKKIDKSVPVTVYGKIGKDEKGIFVKEQMKEVGIDVSGIKESLTVPTSYSDVITEKYSGARTFFHNRGANAEFCIDDVDVDNLDCKIFHIGYLMLLDWFDKLVDGNTGMARLLKSVRDKGIKTSIDIVSESSGDFQKIVRCALPYCDYAIINEIEACNVIGVEPRDKDGKLIEENIIYAMKQLMELGVKEKVVVHCPEKGYCIDKSGNLTLRDTLKLPNGFIKGSVGAGDAFCAGCLYSLYNDYKDDEMLDFASLVAASCLSEKDSISGVRDVEKLKKLFIEIKALS